jgi:hypothetical protein
MEERRRLGRGRGDRGRFLKEVLVKRKFILVSISVATSWLGAADPAFAGIEACGNINIEADAECTVQVEGGCEAQCTPVSVEAACAGELEIECRGECDIEAEASCTASCSVATCVAECEIDPPSFECTAECNLQADATCNAECQADANRRECVASCKATYSASCDASCERTPGSASCQAKCDARCQADCSAKANIDCQVGCQRRGYVDCTARVQGGCEVACREPDGALFCDGQYVDHDGNLDACAAAIRQALSIEVDVTATGSAESDCSGNTCAGSAEGSASASCDIGAVPGSDQIPGGSVLAMLAATLAVFSRRGAKGSKKLSP